MLRRYGIAAGSKCVRFWELRARKRTLVYPQEFADSGVPPIRISFQRKDIGKLPRIRTRLACVLQVVCEGVGMRRKAKISLESRKSTSGEG